MKILLCGASGFIGAEIHRRLARGGHEVVAVRSTAARGATASASVVVDFTRATTAAAWTTALSGGIDAVVNAVGLFRGMPGRSLEAVHDAAPRALFDACALAGVKRVVQVSALGIEGNDTAYARTKRAADQHLLALWQAGRLDGMVLRPSIVFGRGGASSELFMALARSPVLSLPRPVVRAQVQPVAIGDLADAVVRVLDGAPEVPGRVLPCVGPRPLTLAGFIACLRMQQGHRPAQVVTLPDWMTRLSAQVGDHLPRLPWSSDTLTLLAQDNVADPAPFASVLGRAPVAPEDLVRLAWQA